MNKEIRWKDEINLLDVKLEDIELKNNLIEKIVSEEVKLDMRDEEIKILGELVKHQQNNWNELKEWLKEVEEVRYYMTCYQRYEVFIDKILSKMQEIEGGVDR